MTSPPAPHPGTLIHQASQSPARSASQSPSVMNTRLHLLHPHSRIVSHLQDLISFPMALPMVTLVLCSPFSTLCQKGLSNANLTHPSTSSPDHCFTAQQPSLAPHLMLFTHKVVSNFGTPWDCSMPAFPILHYPPEFAQTHVHCVGDAPQPSHPLSSPSPPAFNVSQHQGLFQ